MKQGQQLQMRWYKGTEGQSQEWEFRVRGDRKPPEKLILL